LVNTAQQRATQSRDRAERANAVGRDSYMDASRAFTQGQRIASQNPAQAIDEFLTAEAGFDQARAEAAAAAAAAQPAPATPVPAPQQPPVQPLPTPTVPRDVPKPTEPVPTTPAPQPPVTTAPKPAAPDNSADRNAAEAVVRRYFAARSGLDLAGMQQVYPGLPADRERGALRNIQGACSEFSESPVEVNVLSVDSQEAVVRTRAQTTCKQKAGGQTTTTPPYRVFFELKKGASGTWQVAAVNRPDQTR
jgi:hypothetical protein